MKHFVKPKFVASDIDNQIPGDWAAHSDYYVCGYPCQPWSGAGSQEGLADPEGRGMVMSKVPRQIAKMKPRAYVLENVMGFVQRFPKVFNTLVEALRALELEPYRGPSYNVYWDVLSADAHGGVPQHRERIFIIGIKRSEQVRHFEWPTRLPGCLTLDDYLGRGSNPPVPESILHGKTLKNAFARLKAKLAQNGPDGQDCICDTGSSNGTVMVGKSPCLTASGCESFRFYSNRRGRWLNCNDFAALQGVPPNAFPDWQKIVSEKDYAHMLGNAINVQVLKRIFVQIARARGWQC